MGLFTVGCRIENHNDPKKSVVIPRLLVDTGSEYTWIAASHLEKIGIEPRKRDMQFQMANGQIITRSVGYAIIKVGRSETTDEVVFAQKGDLLLLGCRALEGLRLRVDSHEKRLVAAGPIVAATAVHPHSMIGRRIIAFHSKTNIPRA
jgi:predicted aspartyl protease